MVFGSSLELEVPGSSLEVPGSSLEVSGSHLKVSGSSLVVFGSSLVVSGSSLVVSGSSLELEVPGSSLEVSGSNLELEVFGGSPGSRPGGSPVIIWFVFLSVFINFLLYCIVCLYLVLTDILYVHRLLQSPELLTSHSTPC